MTEPAEPAPVQPEPESPQAEPPKPDFILDWDRPIPILAMTAMMHGLSLVYPDSKWVIIPGAQGTGMPIRLGESVDVPDDFWHEMAEYAKELIGDGDEGR